VHVHPELVNANTGAIAWWVSAENQKARLVQPYLPRTVDVAGWADLRKSHATPDPSPFGLESLLDDPEAYHPDPNSTKPGRKAVSLLTTALLIENNPSDPQFDFHDLSTSAVGLLTNTATGGWRKDLSILTEKWDQIYTSYSGGQLPLFRHSPEAGATSLAPKPTAAVYDTPGTGFYPWSGYSQFGGIKTPLTYNTASASWQSLVHFATKYKSLTFDAGTSTVSSPIGWNHYVAAPTSLNLNPVFTIPQQHFYTQYHEFPLNPVLARVQLVIQANALQDLNPYNYQSAPSQFHRINLRVIPFFTLWNPYNVELRKDHPTTTSPEYGITTMRSMPASLSITNATAPPANGVAGNFKLINGGWSDCIDGNTGNFDSQLPGANGQYYTSIRNMHAYLPRVFTLKPGEVKIFVPQQNSPTDNQGVQNYFSLLLKEGYDVGDNFGTLLANPDNLALARSKTSAADAGTGNGGDFATMLARRFVEVPADNAARRVTVQRGINKSNNPPTPLYGNSYMLHTSDRVKFAIKGDRLSKIFTNGVTTKSGAGADFMVGRAVSQWAPNGGRTALENGLGNIGINRFHSVHAMSADINWARTYWPTDELVEVDYQVSELIADGNNPEWTNLFTVSFGPRLSFGAAAGNTQNRPTKGLVQTNPFAVSAFSIPEQTSNNHPVNGAFDISYHTMAASNDHLTPEVGTAGYITTGFQSGDGLSRLIIAGIPLRPMASLAELQSWNLRGNNPLPPHQFYLIGNSDATPLIRKDGVLPNNPVTADPATNLQHDDAYCANHLLFDDWFFSSIAPQPANFGSAIAKDMNSVYRDYLQGDSPLANRAYRPIGEDQNLSAAEASARIGEILDSPNGDGWMKVASRFEVEGMFNVNSNSVKAWRALLGHARNQQVALHTANGIELDPTEHNHVVSRHTVAADVKAGEDSGLGAAFPSGSEYSGFRTLSDSQLDELAGRMVEQVRLRGPFLSLSEFVNRQLSPNEDLAVSGALQAALNSLTEDPNEGLSSPGNGLSSETMAVHDAKLAGADYAFEKASEGMNTHGFPGWIRQADVLRPIAPILSARDDTFTIRAYGDARDPRGTVIARAWCEATLRRTRDFIDPQDPADSIDPPLSQLNRDFGRRYIITSFRWLEKEEI
jgi:hypothetical protein